MTEPRKLAKGAFVICKEMPRGPHGIVLRSAKDGSWSDVEWTGIVTPQKGIETWMRRMKFEALTEVKL
jgi:hypothetical protein